MAFTDLAFFGDSFTAGGTNGDSLSVRFSTQTANLLGVTEHNFGAGGARQNLNRVSGFADILTAVYQAVAPPSAAPYAPVSGWQASVIQASINNLNLNSVHADLTIVTSALLRAIHRLRAGGCYEALGVGTRWTFPSGSWSDVPTTDANSGTGIKRASSAGSTWSIAVPADFPGGRLKVYGPKAQSFGGLETFTADGSADGTLDNRTATLQSGSQSWEHGTTLSAGAHTIAGTVSPINSVENINGADFEVAGTKPVVIVLNTARSPNYPGGERTIVDADVTASNAAVVSALNTDFPSDPKVVLVDIDAVLGKNPANFGADQIHPNSTGAGLIAAAIAPAITTALGGGGGGGGGGVTGINTQLIGLGGRKPTYAAATNTGDEFVPEGRTFIHIKNGGASSITATLKAYGSGPGGNPVNDRTVTVPAGDERLAGPIDPAGFQGPDGLAQLTYSSATSVTVAVLKI